MDTLARHRLEIGFGVFPLIASGRFHRQPDCVTDH
jgi:hypothetical protein